VDSAALNKIGAIIVVAIWPFAMYHGLHAFFRKPVQLDKAVDVDQIIQEFARRRRIMIRAVVVILASFGDLYLLQAIRPPGDVLLGLSFTTHLFIALAIMAVGIVTGSIVYRCPACGSPPWAPMGGGQWGVDLNPAACPRCGIPLRYDRDNGGDGGDGNTAEKQSNRPNGSRRGC